MGRVVSAGEAIFLARHHRLPTRLLDWTANALYALYFACHTDWQNSARVWALLRRSYDKDDIDPFELATKPNEPELFKRFAPRSVKIIYPFFNSPRLLAQDGAFTIQSNPRVPLESFAGKRFAPSDLDIETLYCWKISRTSKVSIIKELSGLGITHRTVYPDLDGIAQSLWETVVLWPQAKDRDSGQD